MKIHLTNDQFKIVSQNLQWGLEANNIKIKQQKSRDLLAYILTQKQWSEVSPSLPKIFSTTEDDLLSNLVNWLDNKHKSIDESVCLDILIASIDKYIVRIPIKQDTNWTYLNDLESLHNDDVSPFDHFDEDNQPMDAYIVLNFSQRTILASSSYDINSSSSSLDDETAIVIPGNIKGRALSFLLKSKPLIDLANILAKNWHQGWAGYNNDDNEETLHIMNDFQNQVNRIKYDPITVNHAEVFYHNDIIAMNEDGEILEDLAMLYAFSFVIKNKYVIDINANIDILVKQMEDDTNNEIMGIESYVRNFYAIVCNANALLK